MRRRTSKRRTSRRKGKGRAVKVMVSRGGIRL